MVKKTNIFFVLHIIIVYSLVNLFMKFGKVCSIGFHKLYPSVSFILEGSKYFSLLYVFMQLCIELLNRIK